MTPNAKISTYKRKLILCKTNKSCSNKKSQLIVDDTEILFTTEDPRMLRMLRDFASPVKAKYLFHHYQSDVTQYLLYVVTRWRCGPRYMACYRSSLIKDDENNHFDYVFQCLAFK